MPRAALQGRLPSLHTFVAGASSGIVRPAVRVDRSLRKNLTARQWAQCWGSPPHHRRGCHLPSSWVTRASCSSAWRCTRVWCSASSRRGSWCGPSASPDGFIAVAGAGTDPDLIGERRHAAGLGAVAAAPFFAGPEERGALCVGGRDEQRKLESREMELLCELGVLAGEALSHHEQRGSTAGDSQAEIRALVKALAEADGDTYRHSLEVAATATVVGRRLGLTRAELVEVELGALLHDVGKLRLPAQILAKPDRLTDDERRLRACTRSGARDGRRIPAGGGGRDRAPSPRASRWGPAIRTGSPASASRWPAGSSRCATPSAR